MAEKKDKAVPETGKAVVYRDYGDSSSMKVEDVPIPAAGEGEVVIKIKAAGLNPADYKIRGGHWKSYPVKFPAVPGWDLSGVIVDRGHAARKFNVGDEVYAYARRPHVDIRGCYAEYITILESYASLKPKKASFEQAGGIPLAGLTAYQGLQKLALKEGESILVVGASGGVGSFVVQLAKNVFGAKNVIGLASSKSADYLKKIGCTHVLDYKGDYKKELLAVVPNGVDAVYDCFGDNWPTLIEEIATNNARVVSIASWSPPKYTKKIVFQAFLVEPHSQQLADLARFFDEGKISTHVDKVWKLSEAGKAHDELAASHTSGKAVFKMD